MTNITSWDIESIFDDPKDREIKDHLSVILCIALTDENSWAKIRHIRPADFENQTQRDLWIALTTLRQKRETTSNENIRAITPRISITYLEHLRNSPQSGANTTERAVEKIVRKQRIENTRMLLDACLKHLKPDTTENWQQQVIPKLTAALQQAKSTNSTDPISHSITLKQILTAPKPRIPTGLHQIDQYFDDGLQLGHLYAFGGPTRVGKTTLLASISHNLENARSPIAHLIISPGTNPHEIETLKLQRSLELTAKQIANPDRATTTKIAQYTFCQTTHHLNQFCVSIAEIENEIRYHVAVNNIRLTMIDHLQLVTGRDSRTTEESHMAAISRSLQKLAYETSNTIIVTVLEDDLGQIKNRADGIKHSASCYHQMHRDRNTAGLYFETKTNSFGKEHDIGTYSQPAVTINQPGPHFQ